MAKAKKKFEVKTPRGTIYTQACEGRKSDSPPGMESGVWAEGWRRALKGPRRLLIPSASAG